MGATCRPESVNTCRTPSALSIRTRSWAPVEVGMQVPSVRRWPSLGWRSRGFAEPRQAGGKLGGRRQLLVGMEPPGPLVQRRFRLDDVRIRDAAVHRAHRRARLLLVEADALGAQLRIDHEDVLALADRLIGALRHTGAAVDAF